MSKSIQQEETQFLNDLEKKLWTSANKLLPSLDASQYKHVMLGLVFLKYVSDSFGIHRDELTAQFKNPDNDYYLDPADFGGADSTEYQEEINTELEERDYYRTVTQKHYSGLASKRQRKSQITQPSKARFKEMEVPT